MAMVSRGRERRASPSSCRIFPSHRTMVATRLPSPRMKRWTPRAVEPSCYAPAAVPATWNVFGRASALPGAAGSLGRAGQPHDELASAPRSLALDGDAPAVTGDDQLDH